MRKPRYKQVPLTALQPGDSFWRLPSRRGSRLPHKPVKGVLLGHFAGERWPMADVHVFHSSGFDGKELEVWGGARVWVEVKSRED